MFNPFIILGGVVSLLIANIVAIVLSIGSIWTPLLAQVDPGSLVPAVSVTAALGTIFIAFLRRTKQQDDRGDLFWEKAVTWANDRADRAEKEKVDAVNRELETQKKLVRVEEEGKMKDTMTQARIADLEQTVIKLKLETGELKGEFPIP